jgi:hypothetical protein
VPEVNVIAIEAYDEAGFATIDLDSGRRQGIVA